MIKPLLAILLAGTAIPLFAQPAETLTFDVATIKPMALLEPGRRMMFGRRGGPGTNDPGRITWTGMTLMDFLTAAYDVKRFQVNGPDWITTERYDVVATVPRGTTKEQVNVMLQNLLAERWGVTLHHDSKVFQVDELVIAKGGSKLKETDLDPNAEPKPAEGPPPQPKQGKDGLPELPKMDSPALRMMMTMGRNGPTGRMEAKAQTMTQLASFVSNQINHAVVDKTGLTGKYDFAVEFAPDMNAIAGLGGGMPMPPPPGAGPADAPVARESSGVPLETALQQQLGLRLQPAKAPLDVLVIDKANKTPTEN